MIIRLVIHQLREKVCPKIKAGITAQLLCLLINQYITESKI